MNSKTVLLVFVCGVTACFLIWLLQDVEPVKSYVGPIIIQAKELVTSNIGDVPSLISKYSAGLTVLAGTAATGIVAYIRSRFNQQKTQIIAQASDQVLGAQSQVTQALGDNQLLKNQNVTLTDLLAKYKDVDANLAELKVQLEAKDKEVINLISERNEAERLYALVKNPTVEPTKVE